MSNFKSDLKAEAEFAKFLDKSFYPKLVEIGVIEKLPERIKQLDMQKKGIDLVITAKNGNLINVDEKASLNYINTDLKTFVFELSFVKDNLIRTGWFLRNDLETDMYLIAWPNLNAYKAQELERKYGNMRYKWHNEITFNDYNNCEVIFLSKKNVEEYLKQKGYTLDDLKKIDAFIRQYDVLPETPEGIKFFYTKKLYEKPINILIYKSELFKLTNHKYIVNQDNIILL